MSTESFGFTVRPVVTHDDLLRACQVRAIAYGNKIPEYRESMLVPDSVDRLPATGVYLCEDKTTGQAIGTMRVQVTGPGFDCLAIERYVPTPEGFGSTNRAEITRLAAVPGSDSFVRLALWKTGYVHCRNHGVRLLMIAVRKLALIKAYERMGAKDICDPIPLPYAGNLPHRIMAVDIRAAEVFWRDSNHPMLQFMAETHHPDIRALGPMDSMNRIPVAADNVTVGVVQR
jgi:hypothetical protein